jgi:transposase InsO family protein
LQARIRVVHDEDGTYGAPRITAELNDGVPDAERVNHKRVARVMRTAGIAGYRRRRRVKTTVSDPANQRVPDLLNRDFTASAPNSKYVGDITYLPLATGANLYLATVIDCCSRRVAGWAIADHMRTELVVDALRAAASMRGGLIGSIFHSDHGSQYTSTDFAAICTDLSVTQSMGGVGSSADNALAESFNAALKREVLQDDSCWPDAAACRRQVFRWLARYNTTRRHSHCRYVSPADFEKSHAPATLPEAA